jgi:hypothetical protein
MLIDKISPVFLSMTYEKRDVCQLHPGRHWSKIKIPVVSILGTYPVKWS